MGFSQVVSKVGRTAAVAVALAAAAGSTVESATASPPIPAPASSEAQPERTCEREAVPAQRAEYGWPVKPFHRQHAVRGYFGDPRIGKGRGGELSRSFHFGVDVSAPDGTPVYATATGIARVGGQKVSIRLSGGVAFAYWHIVPSVRPGQRVVAYRTVIGHIARGWGHVHFAEWRGGGYVNPLRPGAMGPYSDKTCPGTAALSFERNGSAVEPEALRGSFDIVAEVLDGPAMSAPAPWYQLPVTPAVIRWRVVDRRARAITPWKTAFDVRERLPQADYHLVYAEGTTQNHPDSAGHYRFYLARGWSSASLSNGSYAVEVVATDNRGNSVRHEQPFTVSNSR